jgi:cytochrome c-type biogenesis protein CcmH/NrfF
VTAVGATVRCPICREPIPLNDVQNTQAVQMRQFIRDQLTLGMSEDAVRQALVDRYGAGILLAPPAIGLGLLVWLTPVAAVLVGAGSIFLALRRWSSGGRQGGLYRAAAHGEISSEAQTNAEALHYDEILDRELAARD